MRSIIMMTSATDYLHGLDGACGRHMRTEVRTLMGGRHCGRRTVRADGAADGTCGRHMRTEMRTAIADV